MLTFIHRLIRTLILPNNAGPDQPAIVIGPDLPPCMQPFYSSAIFFRPPNTVSHTIDRPIKFIAQAINPVSGQVDEGWALWDQKTPATICGFYVYKTTITTLAPLGSGNSIPQEYYGQQAQSGAATMTQGGSTHFGAVPGGATPVPWALNVGNGTGDKPSLSPWTIDGIDAPRGLRGEASSVANTAAIGAEAVILTGPTMTFYNGRCYRVLFEQLGQASAANFGDYRIRRTNLAGTLKIQIRTEYTAAGGVSTFGRGYLANTSGGDITDNIVLTLQASAGTITVVGNANIVRTLQIHDCGSSANYPNAIQI